MSRQDILDFQAYLANKYTLPDGVPTSIHQEIYSVVEGYTSAQEEVYEDLVKMVWRVVTAIETKNQVFFPDSDEIPTVEQIQAQYEDTVLPYAKMLVAFLKKHMMNCIKNGGVFGVRFEGELEDAARDHQKISVMVRGANELMNDAGWFVEYKCQRIYLLTEEGKNALKEKE